MKFNAWVAGQMKVPIIVRENTGQGTGCFVLSKYFLLR